MQIFIQLSNEYSYKSLCWPNVTSQRQTSLTVKKTITLPSTTDSQTLWIHLANCPASYTHQKRSPTMNWWKYTMHIPQRSIVLSHRKETDLQNDLPFYTQPNSSNILHFTRLTGRFDTTLSPEGSRTHDLTRGQNNLTKAPHGGPVPRLGVTPGGRKLYHWTPGVGFPISVP